MKDSPHTQSPPSRAKIELAVRTSDTKPVPTMATTVSVATDHAPQIHHTRELEQQLRNKLLRNTLITASLGAFALLAKGVVNGFFLQELFKYFGYSSEEDSSLLIGGAITSTLSSIPGFMAIIAYRREYEAKKFYREQLEGIEQHRHGGFFHILQDMIGIVLPSAMVGFAAGAIFIMQIAYPEKGVTEITADEFWSLFPAGVSVALLNAVGNMLLHGDFLNEGVHEHGNFFASFYDAMVSSITRRSSSCKEKFYKAYVMWGSLFSHISELGFSNSAGMMFLFKGLLHHAWEKEANETGIIASAWILAVVGSAVHVHTEARAFEMYSKKMGFSLTQPIKQAWKSGFSSIKKAAILTHCSASIVVSLFHAAPDILGGPDLLEAQDWQPLKRIALLILMAALLGAPDTITNMTLLLAPFANYIQRNAQTERPDAGIERVSASL